MKAKVDQNLCIACGICEGGLPEVFLIGDAGYAKVIIDPIEAKFHDSLKQIIEECPTTAISIEEETTTGSCCCQNGKPVDEETSKTNTERNINMKIKVHDDLCIGCGICEGIAPEVFSLETEPYAVVLLDPIPEEFQDAVREAAESCPEAAIEIEE